ncbi:MAG: hypothetical protein JXA28_13915 [Bacteroidetes bacterium]|nr:hypothetical protein [Bacteroidota bacterium]
MHRIYIPIILFLILATSAAAQQYPLIIRGDGDLPSSVLSLTEVHPLPLPTVMPPLMSQARDHWLMRRMDGNVLAARDEADILFEGETLVLRIDPAGKRIERVGATPELSGEAQQALEEVPDWLRPQLLLKLRLLAARGADDDFARLITTAEERIKDEVAFTIACSSMQTLTESRFGLDRGMLVRNAAFIYQIADSLQYVRLVESGSYAARNYYTTTEYRIYDPVAQDTVWKQIPRDVYYWYIVHPKMDQEGVYVADNNNDNSGQRTYGYSWREFIWNNPDPAHDYQPVNITTSKGTVTSIPRFGELMKQPRVLWDRRETYLTFNRDFGPGQTALDMLGNWASRAVPVDVRLPRAFQPNQILMKHNGNCNEDAFLVAGACRTALIPIVYLGCHAEDHVFGSVWDEGWHHYEFFRGGLSESGNQFYGITNMLPGGSYGWDISMVEATRPDGYPFNMTAGYADTCTFRLTITDTLGNPMEGTMVQLYAPNIYGQGYRPCMHFYTNSSGVVEFGAGAGKRYLVNLHHPVYGWSPEDSTRAYFLTQANSAKGALYNVNVSYPHVRRTSNAPSVQPPAVPGPYSVFLTSRGSQIVTGVNIRDSQRSRFHRWEAQGGGMIEALLLDAVNYDAWSRGAPFTALAYSPTLEMGAWATPVSDTEERWLVLRNRAEANILEHADLRIELYDAVVTHMEPVPEPVAIHVDIHPHPVTASCVFRSDIPLQRVEIVDVLGNRISELSAPWRWQPAPSLEAGMYFARIHTSTGMQVRKLLLVR